MRQNIQSDSGFVELMLFLSAVIIIGSLAYAHAETFQDVINFPIPDNITGQEKKGQLTTLTDDLLEFTVTYRFHLGQNGTAWFEKILTETGLIPPDITLCPDRFYLGEDGETCYPNPPIPSNFIPDERPPIDKQYETDYERFLKNPPNTVADKDYFALLQELKTCMRGINESKGIATTEQFAVSTSALDENYLQSFELDGPHRTLALAVQECIAIKTVLNPVTLGMEALHKGEYFGYIEIPHELRAIVNPDDWPIVPTQPPQKSLHDFIMEEETAKDIICNSDRVTVAFKNQQGCSLEQMRILCPECVISGYDGEYYQIYNIPDYTPMEKLYQFYDDGGESMARDLARGAIEQAQRELRERNQ